MEKELPHRCDRHKRSYIREKCKCSEYASADHLLIQDDGQSKRSDHGKGHRTDTIYDRILQSGFEERVSAQSLEVIEAFKGYRVRTVPFHKSQRKCENYRDQREYTESDEVRRDEGIRNQITLGLSAYLSSVPEFIDAAVVSRYLLYQFFLYTIILFRTRSGDCFFQGTLQFFDLYAF